MKEKLVKCYWVLRWQQHLVVVYKLTRNSRILWQVTSCHDTNQIRQAHVSSCQTNDVVTTLPPIKLNPTESVLRFIRTYKLVKVLWHNNPNNAHSGHLMNGSDGEDVSPTDTSAGRRANRLKSWNVKFLMAISESSSPSVPPPTPECISDIKPFENAMPMEFPPLDDLELPYVREVGVKSCMGTLGGHLNCRNYVVHSVQFWFLDMLTDCLWRCQDEYSFSANNQKVVLEWVVYFFKLLSSKQLCVWTKSVLEKNVWSLLETDFKTLIN